MVCTFCGKLKCDYTPNVFVLVWKKYGRRQVASTASACERSLNNKQRHFTNTQDIFLFRDY